MRDGVRESLDRLLDRQRDLWQNGQRPTVEELLQGSGLDRDHEAQLDLVYGEVVVREELGERPDLDEYLQRYPELADDLKLHFEIHNAVNNRELTDTSDNREDASWPAPSPEMNEHHSSLRDYEILGPLGQGGMGVVRRARHRQLRRDVAIKMFQPGRIPTSREIRRFQIEAEAMARLTHPNIVQIFEIGQSDGLPYLSLELAEQGTLADKLRDFTFVPTAAAELIETLTLAVQHAHDHQIVHRDLKPANILFTRDGIPKITDFGLARVLEEEASGGDGTRTGEPIGTPRYMSPEQAAGQPDQIGPATDVYGLGTLLFECLTGRAPFIAAGVVETLRQICNDDPTDPRRLQPAIPRDLATICQKCLEKDPERRYVEAAGLADDLRRFLNGRPIRARPTPAWERVLKWCRRRPAHAALIAMSLLLAFGSVSAVVVERQLNRLRISGLRNDVATLMSEGRESLEREEVALAQERFRVAWQIVQGEPALFDHGPGVAGWLDHSHRAAGEYHWRQRVPPKSYPERRDEAVLASLMLEPRQKSPILVAREAICGARELIANDDPGSLSDREFLALLEADLVLLESGPAAALAVLDEHESFPSRLFHAHRGMLLEQLGRMETAAQARGTAEQFPPDPAADAFQRGVKLLRNEDSAAAQSEFEVVLAIEPGHYGARLFQALCALRLDRPQEAIVGLTACIAQRPRFAPGFLYRAQAHAALNEMTLAQRDLQRALDNEPSESIRFATLVIQGRHALDSHREVDAVAAWTQLTGLLPDEPLGWALRAAAESRCQLLQESDEHFALAFKVGPAEPEIFRIRSRVYRERGRWSEALEDLDQAIALNAGDISRRATDQVERGRVLWMQEQSAAAMAATDEAIKLREDFAAAWELRARLLSADGQWQPAIAAWDRCAALGVDSAELYESRGQASLQCQNLPGAVEDFSRALSRVRSAALLCQRGWAYELAGTPVLARQDFGDALKLSPHLPGALLGRVAVQLTVGDLRAARQDAAALGKRVPESWDLWRKVRCMAEASAPVEASTDRPAP